MSGRPQTEIVLAALSAAGQIALRRHGQNHQQEMERLRQAALGDIIEALVTRRVDAVKEGFVALLGQYADQAGHYMAQQEKFVDRELDCDDPLRRIELRSRINDIDASLGTIRAEAALVYAHMVEVVRTIGGVAGDFAGQFAQPLALPSYSESGR